MNRCMHHRDCLCCCKPASYSRHSKGVLFSCVCMQRTNTAFSSLHLQLRRYLEEDRGRQAVLAEDAAAKRE